MEDLGLEKSKPKKNGKIDFFLEIWLVKYQKFISGCFWKIRQQGIASIANEDTTKSV